MAQNRQKGEIRIRTVKKLFFSGSILLMALLLSAISPALGQEKSGWRLDKESNGVRVYTRKVEGYPIREYKAVADIRTSMEEAFQIVTSYDDQEEWSNSIDQAEVIADHPEGGEVVYLTVDTPFPVTDRDMVMWMHEPERQDGTIIIRGETVKGFKEEDPDYVRFPLSEGYWKLEDLGNGQIRITNQYLSDPGGSIPKWVVNSMLTGTPHKTMVSLKNLLEE